MSCVVIIYSMPVWILRGRGGGDRCAHSPLIRHGRGEFEFRIEYGSICREISIVGTLLDHNHVGNYNCIVFPRTVQ